LGEDATGGLLVLKPDHTLTEHPLFPKWETYTDDFWKADTDWRGSVDPALLPVISAGRWSIGATHTLFMELDPFVLEVPLRGAGPRIVTIQLVAGIQTFPLVSSVRTSKGRRPCLAAVAR
jgi:hypothetical protein